MKKNKVKFSILVLLLIVLFFLVYFNDLDIDQISSKLKEISETKPFSTAVIFILIYTLLKMSMVPMTSTSIVTGYLFGVLGGVLVSVLAVSISSSIIFYFARFLGKDYMEKSMIKRFKRLEEYNKSLKKNSFLAVLFFRIVPILPFAVVNIGFGVSKTKFKDFILATVLGAAPGIILLATAGSYLGDWTNPRFYLSLSTYIVIILVSFIIAYKYKYGKK